MRQLYSWPWVEAQVAQTIEIWKAGAQRPPQGGPRFSPEQQEEREKAYDEGLVAVEREAKRIPRTQPDRLGMQDRIVASFARFSASALDLPSDAIHILTHNFLPVGVSLARWARRFDADLSMPDIIQACRNAWTACGLQPLLGERVRITPSILGYSLLYPYSDNYLDAEDISSQEKVQFCERFRERLRGDTLIAQNSREAALWTMVQLIEDEYPRAAYPQVFDCLLAIHQAQEQSITQVNTSAACEPDELLRVSCAKGGTSVLADACLARGWLSEEESQFAFEWGVLLQLGDDLQDVHEDLQRGSDTLFSRTAAQGTPLDGLVMQLLNFADRVGARMDSLPHGFATLRNLLKMSWRSLIVGAVANSHEFFSPQFLQEAERASPFRFTFLRARRERLSSRQGLYATLFDAFLQAPQNADDGLPSPEGKLITSTEADLQTTSSMRPALP
jgi:hypothetical protein